MHDALGVRMKEQYEQRARYFLPRRTWTVVRVDGRAFHTYTRGLDRPFDQQLMDTPKRPRSTGHDQAGSGGVDRCWGSSGRLGVISSSRR